MYTENDFLDEDFDLSTRVGPSLSVSGTMQQQGQTLIVNNTTLDTLDEPVSVTLMRDLTAVWVKLKQVLVPMANKKNILRDWDLWGPLLLCLILSMYVIKPLCSNY
jgi:hypothetical protein